LKPDLNALDDAGASAGHNTFLRKMPVQWRENRRHRRAVFPGNASRQLVPRCWAGQREAKPGKFAVAADILTAPFRENAAATRCAAAGRARFEERLLRCMSVADQYRFFFFFFLSASFDALRRCQRAAGGSNRAAFFRG